MFHRGAEIEKSQQLLEMDGLTCSTDTVIMVAETQGLSTRTQRQGSSTPGKILKCELCKFDLRQHSAKKQVIANQPDIVIMDKQMNMIAAET